VDWDTGLQTVPNWKPFDPKRQRVLENEITLQTIRLITNAIVHLNFTFLLRKHLCNGVT